MGTLSIRYSERIFMALGARRALLAGLTLVLAGLVVFALAPVHADYATQVAPSMLLLGLGAGTAFPALMNLAMSGATPQDAGLASGLVNTTAQVGGALGLAVLATLSTSRSNALTSERASDRVCADLGLPPRVLGCRRARRLCARRRARGGRARPCARGSARRGARRRAWPGHAPREAHAHGSSVGGGRERVRRREHNGGNPSRRAGAMLTRFVHERLAAELAAIPDALVLPLGKPSRAVFAC